MPDAPPPPVTRRARLWEWADERHVPLMSIVITVAIVVIVFLAGRLVYKLREVLLLIVVAGFIALLLNPLVVMLQRVGIRRRGNAVAIVTLVALLVFIGLAYAFGNPLANALAHFIPKLPNYVKSAEHGTGWLGSVLRKYHVQHWVEQNLSPKLSTFAKNLSKPALTLGKATFSVLLALFVIFVLVILLLLEGPKVRTGLLHMMAPERAARVTRIAGEVNRSVTGYMLGNFITSVIAGLVVFVTLFIVGVPYAVLWGLWVALVDFLPMIGGALAGFPTVIFAFVHSVPAGIVTLVVFVVYTQIENHVLNPIVMSRTVHMNPLLVLVAVLVGANVGDLVGGFFGGFVGTLLAIPVGGSVQVIVREAWQSTAPESQLEVVGGAGEGTAPT
ncbi:MAG TPA: AI-2E family transporter [Acidimicrobiales bacterium]|nr:AI-2E family transporter [Acidimicrobiales bacterium]